jgi:hypothetical protein
MAWKRTLLCHHCGEKFSWTQPEWPDECPICHSYVGLDGKPEVAAPHIATTAGKSADNIYRAMERGSEHRAQVAREVGLSAQEANDLKITNMRDDARPGETSAPKLTPQQQAIMQQTSPAQREGVVQRFNAAEVAHPKSGIGSGHTALNKIREIHHAGV